MTTAIDLWRDRVAASRDRTATRVKVNGAWQARTWGDWDLASREVAGGLRSLGVDVGDRVSILAATRLEWVVADVGIVLIGAATVPIYPSNPPRECEYIRSDSGAKVVFVEDAAQLAKLLEPSVRAKLAHVVRAVLMTGESTDPWVIGWEALRADGRAWLAKNPGALEATATKVTPAEIFTIVYTSGTTGPPKGVVLSHSNIVFELGATAQCMPILPDDEQLLFLPLAHIFAKMMEWSSIHRGTVIAFAEGVPQLVANLSEIRPTYMGAVPRVYEKIYAKIQQGFAAKRQKAIPRAIIDYALAVGRRRSQVEQSGGKPGPLLRLETRIADKLVFAKIREVLGGRIRFMVSGGAPLAQEIAEFFHACGILILEAYGLTETTGGTHLARPDRFRFGTVGIPVPGVEVKIAEDGEVLVRGGNLMREYFGKPDATRETIDAAGWFHTGDIGQIEADGMLRITDRKKDLIVTAGGKNVAPQNLESALKAQCTYLSQVVVHGDKRKFLSALVTLNEEAVTAWAKSRGIGFDKIADLATKPEVKALIQDAIDNLNRDLGSHEKIKTFAILPRDLDQEAGELTPTLKVKRKVISEKYKAILDSFYAEAP